MTDAPPPTQPPSAPATPAVPEPPADRSPLSPRNFARLVLTFVGLVWTAVGLAAFADPVGFVDLVDFHLESATARLEVRAVYGGLSLGLAFLHFTAVIGRRWLQPALVMSMATMGGLAAGRLVSLVVDDFSAVGTGFMAAEFVGVGLMAFAMWRLIRD